MSHPDRAGLAFLDVGGGVVPEAFEGVYPWNREQQMSFSVDPDLTRRILDGEFDPPYEPAEVMPVEEYARQVVGAFRREILGPCPGVELYAEPGRFAFSTARFTCSCP